MSSCCITASDHDSAGGGAPSSQVASPQWFDMSPEVDDVEKHIENTPAATKLAQRYVKMMSAVHGAIKQNLYGKPSLIYVSIDRMWTASPWCPGEMHMSGCFTVGCMSCAESVCMLCASWHCEDQSSGSGACWCLIVLIILPVIHGHKLI